MLFLTIFLFLISSRNFFEALSKILIHAQLSLFKQSIKLVNCIATYFFEILISLLYSFTTYFSTSISTSISAFVYTPFLIFIFLYMVLQSPFQIQKTAADSCSTFCEIELYLIKKTLDFKQFFKVYFKFTQSFNAPV